MLRPLRQAPKAHVPDRPQAVKPAAPQLHHCKPPAPNAPPTARHFEYVVDGDISIVLGQPAEPWEEASEAHALEADALCSDCAVVLQDASSSSPATSSRGPLTSKAAARSLTRTITRAFEEQELHDLYAIHAHSMDHVHVSAMLSALAKLSRAGRQHSWKHESLKALDASSLLDSLVLDFQHHFNRDLYKSRELSACLWALAVLQEGSRYSALVDQIATALTDTPGLLLAHGKPLDVSNSMWALARMGWRCGDATSWQGFMDAADLVAAELGPQELSNTLWALGRALGGPHRPRRLVQKRASTTTTSSNFGHVSSTSTSISTNDVSSHQPSLNMGQKTKSGDGVQMQEQCCCYEQKTAHDVGDGNSSGTDDDEASNLGSAKSSCSCSEGAEYPESRMQQALSSSSNTASLEGMHLDSYHAASGAGLPGFSGQFRHSASSQSRDIFSLLAGPVGRRALQLAALPPQRGRPRGRERILQSISGTEDMGGRSSTPTHSSAGCQEGVAWPSMAQTASVSRAVSEPEGLDRQHVATIAWAYARLGVDETHHKALLDTLATCVVAQRRSMTAQGLSMVAWSFAKMGHQHEELVQALAAAAKWQARKLSGQGISNLMWAFRRFGYYDCTLYSLLAREALYKLDEVHPAGLATLLSAWAQSGFYNISLITHVMQATCQRLHEFKPSTLLQLLQASARLCHADRQLLALVSPQVLAWSVPSTSVGAPTPSPSETASDSHDHMSSSSSATGLGDIHLTSEQAGGNTGVCLTAGDRVALISVYARAMAQESSPSGSSHATLRTNLPRNQATASSDNQAAVNSSSLAAEAKAEGEKAAISLALAKVLNSLGSQMSSQVQQLSAQQLVLVATSYGTVNHAPEPLLRAFQVEFARRNHSLSLAQLAALSWSLARLQGLSPALHAILCTRVEMAAKHSVGAATGSEIRLVAAKWLVRLLWALDSVQCIMDQGDLPGLATKQAVDAGAANSGKANAVHSYISASRPAEDCPPDVCSEARAGDDTAGRGVNEGCGTEEPARLALLQELSSRLYELEMDALAQLAASLAREAASDGGMLALVSEEACFKIAHSQPQDLELLLCSLHSVQAVDRELLSAAMRHLLQELSRCSEENGVAMNMAAYQHRIQAALTTLNRIRAGRA